MPATPAPTTNPASVRVDGREPKPAVQGPGRPTGKPQPEGAQEATTSSVDWWRELRSSLWRLRRPAMPHAVVLGLAVCATFVEGLDRRTGGIYQASIAATVASIALASLAVGWVLARHRIPKRWRVQVGLVALFGAGWLVAASLWWNATTFTVLLVGEYVLAARWWRATRIYADSPPPSDQPAGLEPADPVCADWDAYVAGARGALPGAKLTNAAPVEHGRQYTIEFVRGQQSIGDAINAMVRISGGLGLKTSRLVLEDHSSQLPHLGLLKVMDRTPVEDNPPYLGPSGEDGVVRIGPYADWMGEAGWRLWTPGESGDNDGSAWSGAVIGAPGSGKSRTIESIAIGAMWSGSAVCWFIDPQGGASSPALKKYADWYVDLTGAGDMLAPIEGVAAWREFENATEGWTGFTPRVDRPLLVVFIDEAHEVLKGPWGKRLSALARKVRKLGICFVIVSQYPGIETFGSDEALRLSIMAGNGICFRTASNYSGSLMAGLEMDPKKLPDVKGYGFTIRVEGFSRLAPFRNRLCKDPFDQMERATSRAARLDAGSASAAGQAYADRAANAEAVAQSSRTKLDAVRAGTISAAEVIGEQPPASAHGRQGSAGAVADANALLEAMGLHSFPASIPTPTSANSTDTGTGPVGTAAGGREPAPISSAGHAVVLDVLRNGASRPGEIADAAGYSASRVHQILTDLTRTGKVNRLGHGRYALPDREDAA
ncbi:type IV secretory system conjugative DNA transfer family protein [Actinopolymorpha sp. NPDC004070]|uniref:type IV secretory system conjugative DNA transfer family protein n=1 Tax=Actinopolymorpha sp. NPDC004070 TaxID=3154548 RepID=UPI0033A7E987